MLHKTISYQVAESIDLKSFKSAFPFEIYYEDSDEVFYELPESKFIYVFKYGIVSFLNYDEIKIAEFIQFVQQHSRNPYSQMLSDELLIETGLPENKFGFNKVELKNARSDAFRLVMLNVSQSVALDHYSDQTNKLLAETQFYTRQLETRGRLDISGTNLMKYIGKTLNLKNKISENLYIFDSPDVTWDDEYLNRIDIGLKNTFDLQVRFRNVEEGLAIIRENLELFKDILQHKRSTALEWVIIILILVEVVNLGVEKLFSK
jgi:uncharacterized Rmd1/YagE family protein